MPHVESVAMTKIICIVLLLGAAATNARAQTT